MKKHEELASLQRKLTRLEYEQLEANCLKDGCIMDPIKTWRGYILDGQNRLEIANKHKLKYEHVEIELPNLEAAKVWVIDNQLGKRNVTAFEAQQLRAQHAALVGTKSVAKKHGVSQHKYSGMWHSFKLWS